MKIIRAGMAIALLVVATPAWAKPPEIGPLPPLQFTPAEPEKFVLKNGVVVYLLEDHELPLVEMSLKFKTSPGDEPRELRGLLSFMGKVWRVGGTASRTPDQLNEELEFMAAHIETSAGEEAASVGMSCLTKDLAQSLEIFKDVLLHPAFSEDQITLHKSKIMESLRRKNDDPFEIGRRAFRQIVYGKSHYYAWRPTPAFVEKIRKKDLVELHKKIISPNQAILTLSGDIDKQSILAMLDKLFVGWQPFARTVPEFDYTIQAAGEGKIFYVEKDLTQSLIYIGGIGVSRHSPEEYSMAVTNYILGEGGPSRLFMNIRSRMGLAYQVLSFYYEPKGPGLSGVVCQTKAGSTLVAVQALKDELDRIGREPVSASELQMAKDFILNSFIFRFQSPGQIVNERADLDFYGFPSDYLKTYPDKIKRIGVADVKRAAQTYFDYGKMRTVVIGDKKKFKEPLEKLGPITDIPLPSID